MANHDQEWATRDAPVRPDQVEHFIAAVSKAPQHVIAPETCLVSGVFPAMGRF